MGNRIFKVLPVVVAFLILAIYFLYFFDLSGHLRRYRESPEYQERVELKEFRKLYAEDPHGGDTPEETLQLFADAMRKGDPELAAKYLLTTDQAD